MEYKNIQGIVIDTMAYKEKRIILKLFTRELGLISLMVYDHSKKNTTQSYSLFSESVFNLRKNKSFYYSQDEELIDAHYELRNNICAYSFANLLINIIQTTFLDEMIDVKSYDLFIKTLNYLYLPLGDLMDIINAFLIKYISFQGYKPNLEINPHGFQDRYYFSFEEGSIIGFNGLTKATEIYCRDLNRNELAYLKTLLYNKLVFLQDIEIDSIDKYYIFNLLLDYIKYIYEIPQFHSMAFLKSMCLADKRG